MGVHVRAAQRPCGVCFCTRVLPWPLNAGTQDCGQAKPTPASEANSTPTAVKKMDRTCCCCGRRRTRHRHTLPPRRGLPRPVPGAVVAAAGAHAQQHLHQIQFTLLGYSYILSEYSHSYRVRAATKHHHLYRIKNMQNACRVTFSVIHAVS